MSSEIFPTLAGLEYPVVRTPVFSTLVQTSASGKEKRAALWSYPRWKWTLSFNFLRDDANNEFRTLLGFYLARQGAFDSFLFDDPDDNRAVAQSLGTGTGTQTTFQLCRTFGGFTEPLYAQAGFDANTILVNGVAKIFGTHWTIDGWGTANPGLITFTSAPASGATIVATFNYLWAVRFMDDGYDFSKFMNRLWEQKKLELQSLK